MMKFRLAAQERRVCSTSTTRGHLRKAGLSSCTSVSHRHADHAAHVVENLQARLEARGPRKKSWRGKRRVGLVIGGP